MVRSTVLQAEVGSAVYVVSDPEDSSDMFVGWVRREAGEFADGVGEVRARSEHQIHEDTDNGLVSFDDVAGGLIIVFD